MSYVMFMDIEMMKQVESSVQLSVPWYIMGAYAYYMEDNPILSEQAWDWLCERMKDEYELISHPHIKYIPYDALVAQTYLGDYPTMAIQGLQWLRRKYNSRGEDV